MSDDVYNSGDRADEMSEYLQTFLDETEEQLDDLVETMLALERDATDPSDLNEAFRLIHSIKGSAGMMGFENITVLTHHLENRFERFRTGQDQLDKPTMDLVLRCIDFLRQCSARLRAGEQLGSAVELLDELKQLEQSTDPQTDSPSRPTARDEQELAAGEEDSPSDPAEPAKLPSPLPEVAAGLCLVIRFRADLQLADLKARLIVARLSALGDVKSTHPDLSQLTEQEDAAEFQEFTVWLDTQADPDHIRNAAEVDGVEALDFDRHATDSADPGEPLSAAPLPGEDAKDDRGETAAGESAPSEPKPSQPADEPSTEEDAAAIPTDDVHESPPRQVATPSPAPQLAEKHEKLSGKSKPARQLAETMRVDIDRLDNLMNLTGELVVNRARFEQITGDISPAFRKASMLNRIRDFSDNLRRTIERLEVVGGQRDNGVAEIEQLRAGLDLMEEQSLVWDNGRHCLAQIAEAIDQLSRVSHSLQRGVLETRMAPVGPLFNRFKRVIRDLSHQRGKRVHLQIRGEKTELDKRMIDELGDPLVHLVRNSIDHGLESPELRAERGKPEVGTISLEASHSGNNVYILVQDDGGGIDDGKIRAKIVDNGLLTADEVDSLSAEEALEFIWHPGFSTAQTVTDVSGRGVGMDVVKTRIEQLSGTVAVESTPDQGTVFTIRLPLTLAIINCLHVRVRSVIFSIPIDDVREIVSIREQDIVTVQGKQTFDVRGEYLPLISVDRAFQWHDIDYGRSNYNAESEQSSGEQWEVVILQAAGRTIGLRVDELLGAQDIVVKSLSDNFMSIRGLSGASILGDGRVCLILDVGAIISQLVRATPAVKGGNNST